MGSGSARAMGAPKVSEAASEDVLPWEAAVAELPGRRLTAEMRGLHGQRLKELKKLEAAADVTTALKTGLASRRAWLVWLSILCLCLAHTLLRPGGDSEGAPRRLGELVTDLFTLEQRPGLPESNEAPKGSQRMSQQIHVSVNVRLLDGAFIRKKAESVQTARTVGVCEVYSVIAFIREVAHFAIDEWREAEFGGIDSRGLVDPSSVVQDPCAAAARRRRHTVGHGRDRLNGCGESSFKLLEALYPISATALTSSALECKDYETQCRVASVIADSEVLLVDEWSVSRE
ncbi:unnamed protein product [Prorocentrum cordatum]|uniref:Uncharacterized protein n=1 Tax=Prorocentrum cordatum TaxID=2364126 RepID=A0ABN9Y7J7_9DINO|nr:unnamed protein product [Polarella glacialis]